jgi:hypothetical protein
MKNVFKQGGNWKDDKGRDYTVKSVSNKEFGSFISNGWYSNLEDCFALEAEFEEVPEQGSDYETELRAKIKALGGKAGGRSSIATLEKQLKGLQDGNEG